MIAYWASYICTPCELRITQQAIFDDTASPLPFLHLTLQEKEGVNAKILKDVKFPMLLDVYELCSEELQQKLLPMRTHFKAWEDLKAEEARVPVNKATEKAEEKKDLPCVPYCFDDGEFRLLFNTLVT